MLRRLVEQRGEGCRDELPRIAAPVLVDRVSTVEDARDLGLGVSAVDVVGGTEDVVVALRGEWGRG